MRRILTARAHAVRLEALRAALRPLAGAATPTLLVAPARRAADEAVRLDLELEVALGVHRASFRGLALDLAALGLARAARAPLSPLAREATAARALSEVAPELGHLAPIRGTPGLPRTLARTLDDLRRAGVAPDELASRPLAGPDLAKLLAAQAAIVEARGLADDAEVLDRATAAAAGHRLLGRPLFLLDVAPKDATEARFVEALAHASPEVFAVLGPTHPDLARLAAALGVAPEPLDEPPPADALSRARARVFTDAALDETPPDESLRFLSAPGEAREAVEIARAALGHAKAGTPFDRMAVLLRDPGRYQPHLADAFARAEIPACFTREVRQPDPAGRALLALLACAAEDLSAARFAEYLSLGEVPPPEPETGAPPRRKVAWVAPRDARQLSFFSLEPEPTGDPEPEPPVPEPESAPVLEGRLRAPYRWEQLLVDASVVGGRDRWARRLRGLRAELETQARGLERAHPERAARKRAELADLGHLERFALPLVERLAALPRRGATWGVWLDELTALASSALRAPERALRVLAELRVMKDVGPVDLEEVRLVLHERLAFLREEDPDDQPYGRVWVASLDEAAGQAFEVVFLPGLAEGVFPRPSLEDPLLLDDAREALRPGLARRARLAAEERERLRLALGAAERAIEVSYPRIDTARGRPRVLSFYALDLVRAAEGRLPSVRALERRATEAAAMHLGWAAPLDPRLAIDAAEHDLSVLAGRLSAARGASPDARDFEGAGRYLIEGEEGPPNPTLARALVARAARWRSRLGPDDGFVGGGAELRASLESFNLDRRPFAPTHLEKFSSCPYRMYLSGLLRLRPREAPARMERMDPLVRGSLAHAALFAWFERLKEADLLPWTAEDAPAVLAALSEALRATAEALEEEHAPALPAIWAREVEAIERDLRAWVRRELADRQGFSPAHAELAFGLGRRLETGEGADAASRAEPVRLDGGFLVRGSIDLVEVHPLHGRLRVTDYKTGRRLPPARDDEVLRGGRVVQPVLYALAAEATLGAEVEASRLAYCTTKGEFRSDFFSVGPEGRRVLQEFLHGVSEAVTEGWLPAAPERGACPRCDFRPVCGTTEEERLERKKAESFERLRALRDLP